METVEMEKQAPQGTEPVPVPAVVETAVVGVVQAPTAAAVPAVPVGEAPAPAVELPLPPSEAAVAAAAAPVAPEADQASAEVKEAAVDVAAAALPVENTEKQTLSPQDSAALLSEIAPPSATAVPVGVVTAKGLLTSGHPLVGEGTYTGVAIAGVDALAAIAAAELPTESDQQQMEGSQQYTAASVEAAPVPAPAPPALVLAPHAVYHRRSGPTPRSTGLPARTILVAKRLTNSDVSKGRILLPRAAVEANLSFAIGKPCALMAKDHLANLWEFTLQSWANGLESRRVYVLEHAGEYIKHHALKLDDVIGISCTEVRYTLYIVDRT